MAGENTRWLAAKLFTHGTTPTQYKGLMEVQIQDLNHGRLTYAGDEGDLTATTSYRLGDSRSPDYRVALRAESYLYLAALASLAKDTARLVFTGDDGKDYELILENCEYSAPSGSAPRENEASFQVQASGHRTAATPTVPAWTLRQVSS